MNSYIEQVMEKISDLQQQTRFCVNNYDYYHKNNEMDVLRLKDKQLRASHNHFTEFLNTFADLQETLKKATSQCNEVNKILARQSTTMKKGRKKEVETDNKENTYID